jgi:hypothetical protein
MNNYFKIWFKKDTDINTLCVETLPKFIRSVPNGLTMELLNISDDDNNNNNNNNNNEPKAELTTNDRHVFANPTVDSMSAYFSRLLNYRQAYVKILSQKMLQRKEKNLAKMHMGHYVGTDTTTWEISIPDTTTISIDSVDMEMIITAWIWGCKLVTDTWNACLSTDSMLDQDSKQKIEDLRKAATIFDWLTCRGSKEMMSFTFDRDDPIFNKGYACLAYKALAIGLAHVIQTNIEINNINITDDRIMTSAIVGNINMASDIISDGYNILKNIDGADDVGIVIYNAYNNIRNTIYLYSCFYYGRYMLANSAYTSLAQNYMLLVSENQLVTENTANMKKLLESCDIVTSKNSTFDAFINKLTNMLPSGTPSGTSMFIYEMVKLRSLPKLPPIEDDIPEIDAVSTECLLFKKKQKKKQK